MINLITYTDDRQRIGMTDATDDDIARVQSAIAWLTDEAGDTINWVPWNAGSYASWLGPRADSLSERRRWADFSARYPDSGLMRAAINGYADHSNLKPTTAISTLAAKLGCSPNTLFLACKDDRRADLYIPAIHSQY